MGILKTLLWYSPNLYNLYNFTAIAGLVGPNGNVSGVVVVIGEFEVIIRYCYWRSWRVETSPRHHDQVCANIAMKRWRIVVKQSTVDNVDLDIEV